MFKDDGCVPHTQDVKLWMSRLGGGWQVAQALLEKLGRGGVKGRAEAEACILRIDLASIDFHQAITPLTRNTLPPTRNVQRS